MRPYLEDGCKWCGSQEWNNDLTDVDHGNDCPAPLLLDIVAGAAAFAHDGYAARAAALVASPAAPTMTMVVCESSRRPGMLSLRLHHGDEFAHAIREELSAKGFKVGDVVRVTVVAR